MASFGAWDFAVLISILAISACIGIYYRVTGGKQKTTKEYLLADHSMSTIPVALSLMASYMSAITLLGVSNESYQFGVMFGAINLAYILSTPISAYLFLPVFYRMHNVSVYEYLERRFGHVTRIAASLTYWVQMILYMGIVLYAPALALEAVTGVSRVTAILVIGLVCTFYSTIGGLKAVLITDCFQALLMFAALYVVIVVTAINEGGLCAIWNTASKRGRLYFTDFSLDPTVRHTWWSLTCGGMVTYLSLYGVSQIQVQRMLSLRDLRSGQCALWWHVPILSCLSFSTLFSGLAIFHYYRDCDPVLEGRIKSRDQIMPLFAVDTLGNYPGVSGLFVSGIFAASLSTVSSAVNSLAAVTLEDYLKPLYFRLRQNHMEDSQTTVPTKLMAFMYGIICIILAFVASSMGGVLQASLTIFGVVGGPLLAVFTLGMCTTRGNQGGALTGLLLGLLFALTIGFGGPKPPPPSLDFSAAGCTGGANVTKYVPAAPHRPPAKYFLLFRISYMWFSVLGFLITLFGGYCASVLLEKLKLTNNLRIYLADNEIDCDLFIPPLARKLLRRKEEQLTKM